MREMMGPWQEIIAEQLGCALAGSELPGLGPPERRGLSDIYTLDDYSLVVATDRAANAGLATIPFKGEVVTRMATWWLDVTGDLAPSAVERVVDPQALLVRRCQPLPIGFAAYARLSWRVGAGVRCRQTRPRRRASRGWFFTRRPTAGVDPLPRPPPAE